MYGVLAGLLLGLIVAAGVAFYVTRAPMPFVDKASHDTPSQQARVPDPRQAPDPNGGLYGRDGAAGTAPSGPTATAPSPLPGVTPANPGSPATPGPAAGAGNDLDALIAGLPQSASQAPAPAANTSNARTPAAGASAPSGATTGSGSAAPSTAKPASTGSYLLQAGAFRAASDAESLRARIILLGLPAGVQRAEVNGAQVNRVRVGPFSRLDDMNRARAQLGENKIESAVVRQ